MGDEIQVLRDELHVLTVRVAALEDAYRDLKKLMEEFSP